MIRQYIYLILFAGLSLNATAQTVLFEEDFNSGIPASWTLFNMDGLNPADGVSDFTEAWIGTISGTDTAAASTSFYDPIGAANDYLISPRISLGTLSRLIWDARSVDASYPDGYQVLISTTDSLVASFTDTLLTVTAELNYLNRRTIELDVKGYANQDVFIAFRNNTDNGYILLIDNVFVLGSEFASIELDKAIVELNLYPNPANNRILLSSSESILKTIIYSADGRVVMENSNDMSKQIELSIESLQTGIYYIRVETEIGLETISFIKE